MDNIIGVILCGGCGSRLFPLSRNNYPKQFLKLNSNLTLIQETILRLKKCNIKEIIIASNIKYKNILIYNLKELNNEIKEINIKIILEPKSNNTAPIINLILKYNLDKKILFVPSDHLFNDIILNQKIKELINKTEKVGLIGIKPTYPATGFGYIKVDENLNILNFIEKPALNKAEEFINNNYLWNSGIFLLDANYILNLFKQFKINIYNSINNCILKELENNIYLIDDNYLDIENISIDYAIIENLNFTDIKLVIYDDLWTDIGSFKALYDIAVKNNDNINNLENIINHNSTNCYINSNKQVMLNHVNNLSIIDTPDMLLISDLNNSESVKKIYELSSQKDTNLIEFRPWGMFEVIKELKNMKIKKIIVYPKSKLSLQSHKYRKEFWICINGTGKVQLNDKIIDIKKDDFIFIDIENKHRLINDSETDLEITEVQIGEYLGEDDIIRYEDDYNRI